MTKRPARLCPLPWRSQQRLDQYAAFYNRIADRLREHPRAVGALEAADKALVLVGYGAYGALLVTLLLKSTPLLFATLAVSAGSFGVLSLVRAIINAPRPQTASTLRPLTKHHESAKSFPRRHVFSRFIITTCWMTCCPVVGGVLAAVGLMVAASRVATGAHFPIDVVAGAILGLAVPGACFALLWAVAPRMFGLC